MKSYLLKQRPLAAAFSLVLTVFCVDVNAQVDTTLYKLDTIVVTGDRAELPLKEMTKPVSIISRAEIKQLPARNLVDVLNFVPGLSFVDQDGDGLLPMPIVRGFFGGGEAEYVLLIIDGVPVNDLRNGLVNWNAVALSDIERIEVSRGGGSAAYGDLALGAVVNIETKTNALGNSFELGGSSGSFNSREGYLQTKVSGKKDALAVGIFAAQSAGFRDHSDWKNAEARLTYTRKFAFKSHFNASVDFGHLDKDEPGPLTRAGLLDNRSQSTVLFADDNRKRNSTNATLRLNHSFSEFAGLIASGGVRYLTQDQIRTIQVASEFGDTQQKDETNTSGWSQLQFRLKQGKSEWISGIDAELGSYEHDYFAPANDSLLSGGGGRRVKAGLYLENRAALTKRFRTTIGVRADWLANRNTDNIPDENSAKNFSQVSPRAGFNYQYSRGYGSDGHVFMNWSQAFKAPTLDQLYDRRVLDLTSVFGFAFNFANDDLKPQRSNNYDLGVYQQIPLGESNYGELSLAAYWLDIKNEIDLDLATFKYGNILESRHRGLEGELTLGFANRYRLQTAFTYSDATFDADSNDKKRIKNIPEITNALRLSGSFGKFGTLAITHRYFGEVFLDDVNLFTLPAFQTVDARLGFDWRDFGLSLSMLNVLDKTYNSSGYVFFDNFIQDNVEFLYPARGRYMEVELSFSK